MAAFTGYCAALGVAQWLNDGLPPWEEFYRKPDDESDTEYTSDEYIARYNSWT